MGTLYWIAGAAAIVALTVVIARVATTRRAGVPPPDSAVGASAATAGTTVPPSAPPAANRAAPSIPAVVAPPPAPAPALPRAEDVRQSALDLLASGQRERSLDTIAAGLKSWPDDAQLRAMLSAALADARARLRSSHDAANKERPSVTRVPDYRDALRAEQEITALARAGRTEAAIRAAWVASDRFARAAVAARSASNDSASKTAAEPPAAPAAVP